MTSQLRPLPDFIIAGAQKSGTTSLRWYLGQHPNIKVSIPDEVHFFDVNFNKGLGWYRRQFPILFSEDTLTGEASPYYLFHPLVPGRIDKVLDDVKVFILLRDPIDRAYSHYQHNVSEGREDLDFLRALDKEEERISKGFKKVSDGEDSYPYRNYSYISRSIYKPQVQRFIDVIGSDNIMFIKSSRFFEYTKDTLRDAFRFLGVKENVDITTNRVLNGRDYRSLNNKEIDVAKEKIGNRNEGLEELVGFSFNKRSTEIIFS